MPFPAAARRHGEAAGRPATGWRECEPPRRPVLFVNPRSGGGRAAAARLPERAARRGIETVLLAPGLDHEAAVRQAAEDGADALGMAGGDGSLALVAAVAAEFALPFVCVPAGTRNHFALDVGLDPGDLAGALDAFTAGLEREIDIGDVNGRPFLNNVSLGLYGDAVSRSTYRSAKVSTLLETAAEVIGPAGELPDLLLLDETGREHRRLAVVLVSNNPYAAVPRLGPGARPSLDTGRLGILILGAFGEGRPLVRTWVATSLDVQTADAVHAGVDGEATLLGPSLRFAIRPGAVRVRVPRRLSPTAPLPPVPHPRRTEDAD